MLFVSHLKRTGLSTTFQFDRRRLGLVSGPLQAADALSGTPIALEGDALPLTFDGMTYRVIELRDRHFKPSLPH